MAMESQGLSFTDHMEPQAGIHKRKRGSTAKERISKMPPCGAGKRSSIYRGVTRHRWTGRYEAHLWDKSTWNQTQNKKGKQVYLGAYDEEEAAARAYDLAALKYWGPGTLINFPVSDYARDIEEMQNVTREEYLASLRRKSSGFSRGISKYKGVARHHQNGRWEARIGRVFGSKYLYLGTQEEAAAAYDMAAIEYRGVNTVTNLDLSRYIRWLRPLPQASNPAGENTQHNTTSRPNTVVDAEDQPRHSQHQHRISQPLWPAQCTEPYQLPSLGLSSSHRKKNTPSALGLLLQSSMFQQMLEKSAARQKLQKESEITNNFTETENGNADFDHGYLVGCNQLSGDTNYKECYKDLKVHPACLQVEAPNHGSFEKEEEEEEEAEEKKTLKPKDEGGLCLWSSDFSAISN